MIIVLKVSTTEKYQEGYSYHEKTENVANRSSCDLLSHRHLCMDLSGLEAKEREDAARLEAWRAERAARETLKFKVVGVTFKNEDGKSRQTLLRKLHFGDAPFNSDEGVDITIERGAYQGEPAFSVFAEGHQVGNISKDDVPFFVRRWSDFVGVTSAEVYGGGTDDEGHSINYGMKINCEFRKQA